MRVHLSRIQCRMVPPCPRNPDIREQRVKEPRRMERSRNRIVLARSDLTTDPSLLPIYSRIGLKSSWYFKLRGRSPVFRAGTPAIMA